MDEGDESDEGNESGDSQESDSSGAWSAGSDESAESFEDDDSDESSEDDEIFKGDKTFFVVVGNRKKQWWIEVEHNIMTKRSKLFQFDRSTSKTNQIELP